MSVPGFLFAGLQGTAFSTPRGVDKPPPYKPIFKGL